MNSTECLNTSFIENKSIQTRTPKESLYCARQANYPIRNISTWLLNIE